MTYPPQPGYQPAPLDDPGQTLSIVGIVMAVLISPVGIVLGVIGRKQSREAGFSGTLGTVAMWLGIGLTVLYVLAVFALLVLGVVAYQQMPY